MQRSIFFIFIVLLCPSLVSGEYLTGAEQLKSAGAEFSWRDVESRSVKILLEYQNGAAKQRLHLGSGFLISLDGLFITAYHVMKYCLEARKASRFADLPIARKVARACAIWPRMAIANMKSKCSRI